MQEYEAKKSKERERKREGERKTFIILKQDI